MSLDSLVREFKMAYDTQMQLKINEYAKAKRGLIREGRFWSGGKSYAYRTAVDVKLKEGKTYWAQISQTGVAVIVGE